MSHSSSSSGPSSSASWFVRYYPAIIGCLFALLPIVVYRATIAQFFWFGDDWGLLGEISREGLWHWIAHPWAESYSPLFKFVWGGSVFLFNGSYFSMLAVIWLSHAIAVALFGHLLRRCGFGWMIVVPALAIVGLPSSNIETLCWSVQLSPMLANMFFAAAVLLHVRYASGLQKWSWRIHGWVVLCIAASALCYSRGVLTGAVLAGMSLLPLAGQPAMSFARRIGVAVAYVLPALAVVVTIMALTKGNQQELLAGKTDKFIQMFQFGLWYFCLNPLYHLLGTESWGSRTTLSLGLVKVAAVVWALRHTSGSRRWLLALLLGFDLGNAVLLGIGRYHTGLRATVSSRYQYCALLATIPFLTVWLEWAFTQFTSRFHVRTVIVLGLTAALATMLMRGWRTELGPWVDWRGLRPRAELLSDKPLPSGYLVPGDPGFPPDLAKTLITRFDLH